MGHRFGDRLRALRPLVGIRHALVLSFWTALSWSPPSASCQEPEVTPDDVKKFLDPTMLINSLDYSFDAIALPGDVDSYNHTVMPVWALSSWTAVWAEIPYRRVSIADGNDLSGIGDIALEWGVMIHEDLERRFTSSVASLEVQAPTGSYEDGTGLGRWVLAPTGALALNPTDLFPIYVEGQYNHSVGGDAGEPVRALELTVTSVQILPKGFYVSVTPMFFFDFHENMRGFSLSVAVGAALTRNFAWAVGYARHVAGTKRFDQGLSLSLGFIWGEEKTRDR